MANESVIEVVRNYLQTLNGHGIHTEYGVIFGSQVDGHPDHWSDIDLLVVSARFDDEYDRKDIDRLWHHAARVDSRIEPIPVGQRQFEKGDSNAIIEIARRHGEKISVSD